MVHRTCRQAVQHRQHAARHSFIRSLFVFRAQSARSTAVHVYIIAKGLGSITRRLHAWRLGGGGRRCRMGTQVTKTRKRVSALRVAVNTGLHACLNVASLPWQRVRAFRHSMPHSLRPMRQHAHNVSMRVHWPVCVCAALRSPLCKHELQADLRKHVALAPLAG